MARTATRSVRITDGAHAAAVELCARAGVPLQEWVDDLIRCAVAVPMPPAPPPRHVHAPARARKAGAN